MATSVNRAGFWTDQVWKSIDEGVMKAVGAIRTARKVFQPVQLQDVTSVPADDFNAEKMSIAEGNTKPYVELAVEFQLSNGQVNADPVGATAITLAKLDAKALALAEDIIIMQGKGGTLPSTVTIESGGQSIGNGILGLLSGRTIVVNPPDPGAPTNSGGEILAAVSKGIALLTKDQQAMPWALIEDTNAFAATWGSVINGAPAYSVLNPVLTGGIFGTGAMPANTGLLIALGGDPTTICVGSEPLTEATQKTAAGQYLFRTFERVQFVARDQRAFVKLDFSYLGSGESAKRK